MSRASSSIAIAVRRGICFVTIFFLFCQGMVMRLFFVGFGMSKCYNFQFQLAMLFLDKNHALLKADTVGKECLRFQGL